MLNLELHNNSYNNIKNIDMTSYVTSHTEYVNYNKFTDEASSMIEFISSEIQTPSKNILIKDLSWKHPRNNINYILEFEDVRSNFVFKIPFREIYITNILNENNEALFYKHKKRFLDNSEITIVKRVYGDFVEGENQNPRGWKFSGGYVYNNYENKYNFDNGSYELYYINGLDENGNEVHELLSNVEAIGEFSWRDIDLDTGEVTKSGYTKNQIGSEYEFNVQLSEDEICDNDLNKLYIKSKEENIIKLLKPETISLANSWSIRVQNGFFFKDKKYYISEYNNQSFDPEIGILKLNNKRCYLVHSIDQSNIIKLPLTHIVHDPNRLIYIKILVKDINGNITKAITSNTSLVDTFAEKSNVKYTLDIISVDEKSGFIEVSESILPSEEIFCTFHHESKDYFLSTLNFNPLYNKKIISGRYYFYLKPNMKIQEKSIQWIYLDKDDTILECSDKDLKQRKEDESFNENTIINNNLIYFKQKYIYGYNNSFDYLELGEVSYKETAFLDEILNFNISDKTPIEDENFKEFLKRQWKVLQSKFGYGEEGQVYQNNNIVYIRSPLEVLNNFGGLYSESELYELLKLKLHTGTDIVFDWDYYDLSIDLKNNVLNRIDISMSWEGPGEYILYKINNDIRNTKNIVSIFNLLERPENDLIIHNDTIIEDNVERVYYQYEYKKQLSEIAGIKVRR